MSRALKAGTKTFLAKISSRLGGVKEMRINLIQRKSTKTHEMKNHDRLVNHASKFTAARDPT